MYCSWQVGIQDLEFAPICSGRVYMLDEVLMKASLSLFMAEVGSSIGTAQISSELIFGLSRELMSTGEVPSG